MTLKVVEEMLDETEETEDEVEESTTKEEIAEIKGSHIKSRNNKEWIVDVDGRKAPCKHCPRDVQESCKNDLKEGYKIEFYRKNNTCVTFTDGKDEEEE